MGLWERITGWFKKKPKTEVKFGSRFEITPEQPSEVRKEVRVPEPTKREKEFVRVQKESKKKSYGFDKLKQQREYEEKISKKNLNSYNWHTDTEMGRMVDNAEDMKGRYSILLQGKVKDSRLFNDMITYREQLLKKRINIRVRLVGKKTGDLAIYNVIGALPEWQEDIRSFWLGRKIYNDFISQIEEFKGEMNTKNKAIIGTSVERSPGQEMQVMEIRGTTSFV